MVQVTCKFCKEKIDKSIAYNPSPRNYYCNETCYKNQQDKDKYKPPKESENPTTKSRRQFTDYIQSIYLCQGYKDNGDIPWQMMMTQTKRMLEDNTDWKYSGLKYTLWYMISILGMNLFDENFNGSILNLLPFYYEDAKLFCSKLNTINKEIDEISEDWLNCDIVYNKPYQRNKLKKHKEEIKEL